MNESFECLMAIMNYGVKTLCDKSDEPEVIELEAVTLPIIPYNPTLIWKGDSSGIGRDQQGRLAASMIEAATAAMKKASGQNMKIKILGRLGEDDEPSAMKMRLMKGLTRTPEGKSYDTIKVVYQIGFVEDVWYSENGDVLFCRVMTAEKFQEMQDLMLLMAGGVTTGKEVQSATVELNRWGWFSPWPNNKNKEAENEGS